MKLESYCPDCQEQTIHVKKAENHHFNLNPSLLKEAWKCLECGAYNVIKAGCRVVDTSYVTTRMIGGQKGALF